MVVSDQAEYDHFKYVAVIQDWLKAQPHLPQNIRKLTIEILGKLQQEFIENISRKCVLFTPVVFFRRSRIQMKSIFG